MRLDEIVAALPKPGENVQSNIVSLPKLKKYIDQHCSRYLNDMQTMHRLIFRGIPKQELIPFVGHSENNRKPRDTKITFQRAIDSKLKAAGFKALRSNSIFVTVDHIKARNYGNLFAIFPFDSCNFTWSTEYSDLSTDLGIQRNASFPADDRTVAFIKDKDNVTQFIQDYGFRNDDFKAAIKYPMEIYINGTYVAVPFTKEYAPLIDDWVGRVHDHPNWFRPRPKSIFDTE